MIDVQQGHLGMGQWKIEKQNGVPFLSHRLAFSPRNEYRIGANEIVDVQVQTLEEHRKQVRIELSDDRFCIAWMSKADFEDLLQMVNCNDPAPEPKDNQHVWIKGMIVFFIALLIFELAR